MEKILERIYRRLLSEGQFPQALALSIVDHQDQKTAVLYDVQRMKEIVELLSHDERSSLLGELIEPATLGFILISKSLRGCHRGWEVKFSASKQSGMGDVLYSAAFYMANGDPIFPDRVSVSGKAEKRWFKIHGDRASIGLVKPFDNVDAHDESGKSRFEHPHHTDDLADDCQINSGDQHSVLNYAYYPIGNERSKIDYLLDAHKECVGELRALYGISLSSFNEDLYDAGIKTFDKVTYGK